MNYEENLNYEFKLLINEGELNKIKKYYLKYFNNNNLLEETLIKGFNKACKNGNKNVAEWILLTRPNIIQSLNIDKIFCYACKDGLLNMAEWLLRIKPDINISAENEKIFRYTCDNNYLEVAQWLLVIKPDINISALDEYTFRYACIYNNLRIAQWLLEIKPDINIFADDNAAIEQACDNSHFELALWLLGKMLEKKSDININKKILNKLLHYTCEHEKLNIIEELLEKKPEINELIFIFTCTHIIYS